MKFSEMETSTEVGTRLEAEQLPIEEAPKGEDSISKMRKQLASGDAKTSSRGH